MKIEDDDHAVTECLLFGDNTYELYKHHKKPVEDAIRRFYQTGTYDHRRAETAFYRVACEYAKAYEREFGHRFTRGVRVEVAKQLAAAFRAELDCESV